VKVTADDVKHWQAQLAADERQREQELREAERRYDALLCPRPNLEAARRAFNAALPGTPHDAATTDGLTAFEREVETLAQQYRARAASTPPAVLPSSEPSQARADIAESDNLAIESGHALEKWKAAKLRLDDARARGHKPEHLRILELEVEHADGVWKAVHAKTEAYRAWVTKDARRADGAANVQRNVFRTAPGHLIARG
jgi:hypothetical protein